MFLGWLGFCLLMGSSSLGFNWGDMAVPFLSLLAQVLVYAALALLLSMFLPSRSLAAMLSGLVMVAGYMMSSLAFMDQRMASAAQFMPYHYFQPVLSLQDLDLGWLFALLGASLLMALIAWLRFVRRDIRLSGEGSWRLPLLPSRSRRGGSVTRPL